MHEGDEVRKRNKLESKTIILKIKYEAWYQFLASICDTVVINPQLIFIPPITFRQVEIRYCTYFKQLKKYLTEFKV